MASKYSCVCAWMAVIAANYKQSAWRKQIHAPPYLLIHSLRPYPFFSHFEVVLELHNVPGMSGGHVIILRVHYSEYTCTTVLQTKHQHVCTYVGCEICISLRWFQIKLLKFNSFELTFFSCFLQIPTAWNVLMHISHSNQKLCRVSMNKDRWIRGRNMNEIWHLPSSQTNNTVNKKPRWFTGIGI